MHCGGREFRFRLNGSDPTSGAVFNVRFPPIADAQLFPHDYRMKFTRVFGIVALCISSAVHAQVVGKRTASTCLDLRQDKVAATGFLKMEAFPGPPNYDSIKAGDHEEDVFMLEVPEPDCVDETPGTSEGDSDMFIDVQVGSGDNGILKKLATLIGRKVTVTGTAFTPETAHHHSALVVMATEVKPSSN